MAEPAKPMHKKAFVVVGGTTGLGLSGANAILRAGGSVVVTGRTEASGKSAEQQLSSVGNAAVLIGDAQDASSTRQAIDLCVERFGRFDGLYHVAGGSGRRMGDGPLHEVTDEGIDATLSLNLASMIKSNREAVQAWLEGRAGTTSQGVVLNMGSVLGWSPSPNFFATHVYASAKSAIIGFSKSCAAYYASHGLRFNVIAPALVETPMAQRAATNEGIMSFIKTKQPLDGGRIGQPEDLDDAVVYLLSDQSRYVTGQVLAVDGGWAVSEGQIGSGS
ncbi:MAG: SDR family NAD(P)-dependent oxidoreductase [Phycisphaeraceae bacterium]